MGIYKINSENTRIENIQKFYPFTTLIWTNGYEYVWYTTGAKGHIIKQYNFILCSSTCVCVYITIKYYLVKGLVNY